MKKQRKSFETTKVSQKQDARLRKSIDSTAKFIAKKYAKLLPKGTYISHTKTISRSDSFNLRHLLSGEDFSGREDYSNFKIKPDGGNLCLVVPGEESDVYFPLVISEAKHQGTNDKLVLAGKKPQAVGNAIERASKNDIFCRNYTGDLSYYPFVIFADGCDFASDSELESALGDKISSNKLDVLKRYSKFTRSKLGAMQDDYKLNTLYVSRALTKGKQIPTIYTQYNDFTIKQMKAKLKEVAEISLNELLNSGVLDSVVR